MAGLQALGPKTVLCVPSKAIDAWLWAAVLEDDDPTFLHRLECERNLAERMNGLPKRARVRKSARDYRAHSHKVTDKWDAVMHHCTQAARFSAEVRALFA